LGTGIHDFLPFALWIEKLSPIDKNIGDVTVWVILYQ